MSGGPRLAEPPGLIVALDQPDLSRADALAAQLSDKVTAFKVGLTLFTAHGPRALTEIARHGRVFCDLKFYDIPSQVGSAAAELARWGVWMFTVHASGGAAMIEAAVEAAGKRRDGPTVAAVTVLTSTPADGAGLGDSVLQLATSAVSAGAGAVVCSPRESAALRAALGPNVKLVVPGVRRAVDDAGDQSRTASPSDAAKAGASYIVVGRPITASGDPASAASAILEELAS
ncbi:MAG: orotidine-5'-phosphate decarboxylase [Actinomycetota bacterium]|nr:orotidine-5'-phosphate decarboxylase [Actinomycetota bacterium]